MRTLLDLLCPALLVACGGGGVGGGTTSQGYLWYAGSALSGFRRSEVGSSGDHDPGITVTADGVSAFHDVILDRGGNVWALAKDGNRIYRFPASAVQASGNATPDLVVTSAALLEPGNLAFDSNGNLWVADRQGGASAPNIDGVLMRFDGVQALSGTQDLTPSLQIRSSAGGPLRLVGNIAFDAAGDLWATSWAGIVRFNDPRTLTGSLTLTPYAIVQKAPNVSFYAIAFDSSGALWAATAIGFAMNSVEKFVHPAALSGATTPVADVTIAGVGALPAGGLAFDADGNLWMLTGSALVEYTAPSSLSGSVNPTPAVTLTVSGGALPALGAHLALFPTPDGLPVY